MLQVLAARRDVLNDTDFKSFIEVISIIFCTKQTAQIDKHLKIDSLTKVKELSEIRDLPRGVRDLIYLPQKGVLFALLSETSVISKLGTFISNFSNPKGKEEISSVVFYKEDPPNSLEFTRVWKKSFENEVIIIILAFYLLLQASTICLDPTTPYLAIGFVNGTVTCLKLSPEDNFAKQQEVIYKLQNK